ncbi:MAG: GNAT family N-acetyltransferase [Boseongicola sp.]|nr:GNAT family N-acetyltransferase [Boseongicola sp.]MDE0345133.1 GNAT family N-acetyltransferase [Boseongicola sp.]MXW85027.1 GNAT family N-acetyltransferase [Boseongicola sp. SB0667_bin_21]MYI68141.1 GNAT family N-acetyltransferase [Boseongicola sp. SB0673_bin_14]
MKLDTIANQPVIQTERLILRPLRRSDAAFLELFGADARVARMTRNIPHPQPPGGAEAFVERALADERTEDVWALDGKPVGQGAVLGLISLEQMDREQSEVSYWVVPAFWNTGLATEALQALIDANPHNDKTMFASVFQDNPASDRVLRNTGFQYLGDAETFSVARGTTVPTWTYLRRLE